jgi:hypothetical protein
LFPERLDGRHGQEVFGRRVVPVLEERGRHGGNMGEELGLEFLCVEGRHSC